MFIPLVQALKKLPKFADNAAEADALAAKVSKIEDTNADAVFQETKVFKDPVTKELMYALDPKESRIDHKALVKYLTEHKQWRRNSFDPSAKEPAPLKLGDIFKNDSLYAVYPDMKDTTFNTNVPFGSNGSFRIKTATGENQVSLSFTRLELYLEDWKKAKAAGKAYDATYYFEKVKEAVKDTKSTLYHELQHNIQYESGRPGGGSPSAFVRPSLRNKLPMIPGILRKAKGKLEEKSPVVAKMKADIYNIPYSEAEDETGALKAAIIKEAYKKDPTNVGRWASADKAEAHYDKVEAKQLKLYHSIMGEIEARKAGEFAVNRKRFKYVPIDPVGIDPAKARLPPSDVFKDLQMGLEIDGKTYVLPTGTPDEKVRAFVLKKMGL